MKKQIIITLTFLFCFVAAIAQSGTITNIRVLQGTGTDLRLVDILFDLTGTDIAYDITLEVSFNNGFDYIAIDNANVTGELVAPGNNIHLVWDGSVNHSAQSAYNTRIKITATTHVLAIGDYFQGGVIAYILQSGDPGYVLGETHGLIAAVSDASSKLKWSSDYNTTNATGTAIGTGQSNTDSIINSDGSNAAAAYYCDTLTMNGYDDWFLPSKDELDAMYNNKATINTTAENNGGGSFTVYYYWSSTEYVNVSAWLQCFDFGYQYYFSKSNTYRVRAVRAF